MASNSAYWQKYKAEYQSLSSSRGLKAVTVLPKTIVARFSESILKYRNRSRQKHITLIFCIRTFSTSAFSILAIYYL